MRLIWYSMCCNLYGAVKHNYTGMPKTRILEANAERVSITDREREKKEKKMQRG